jgi:hypothetical protein
LSGRETQKASTRRAGSLDPRIPKCRPKRWSSATLSLHVAQTVQLQKIGKRLNLAHMPTVSQFYGISVRMYFDDHPPPHFHVYYGSDAAKIDINTLDIIEGELRRRTLALVVE